MAVQLDCLAFGAHPDDVEIGAGAFLLKMKGKGYRTGIVHLTDGDMGAGTPEERRGEAAAAARLLRVDTFDVLNLGDTRLEDNVENRRVVASLIRRYQPKLVLAPYYGIEPGRGRGHADHIVAGNLVTHAANFAHLEKFPAEGAPHAIRRMLYYFTIPFERPTFIVPVDEEVPKAIEAIRAHQSQFNRPGPYRELPGRLEAIYRYYGLLVGTMYGQAFLVPDLLRVEDPLVLLG